MEKCISCVFYSSINRNCEFNLSTIGEIKEITEDSYCDNFEDVYFTTKER